MSTAGAAPVHQQTDEETLLAVMANARSVPTGPAHAGELAS